MNEFNVGDVVSLQSGGAEMTVTSVRADGVITTMWTDANGVPQNMAAQAVCFFNIIG